MTDPRAERWAALRMQGRTLQSIADDEGLSRERVRQVIKKAGLLEQVQQAQAAQVRERQKARARERQAQRRAHKFRVAPFQPPADVMWSDDEIVAAIRTWLEAGGSGLRVDWQAAGLHPSAMLVTKRIGWRMAVSRAKGIPAKPIAPRSDRISEQVCLNALVAFLRDAKEPNGGYDAYADWARRHQAPGPQTVRNRFGTWSAAKRLALGRLDGK